MSHNINEKVFMKNFIFMSLILCFLLTAFSKLEAQLPPTIYRTGPKDSAVDVKIKEIPKYTPSVSVAFGQAFCAHSQFTCFDTDRTLTKRPLSVSFWAKIESHKTFNIFLAFDQKSSPNHWELYSFANSGEFSLYMPGNKAGTTIKGGPDLADGRWHFLAAVLDKQKAELFVDGRSVARGGVDYTPVKGSESLPFVIGALANGAFGNDPLIIDELHITANIRSFSTDTIPVGNASPNKETLLLCHFEPDQKKEKNTPKIDLSKIPQNTDPASAVERFASIPKYLQASAKEKHDSKKVFSFEKIGDLFSSQTQFLFEGSMVLGNRIKPARGSSFLDNLFPSGGTEIPIVPGVKPQRNIPIQKINRQVFTDRKQQLGIVSVSFDDFRNGVFESWGEQFIELEKEISGALPLPRGAADQVFDSNTLIDPIREKYPVQVVLRRTKALIRHLEEAAPLTDEQWISVRDLSKLEQLYSEKEIQQYAHETIKHRETDYFIVCALRRKLMFTNPDLDGLDRILFLARACYAGSRLTNMFNSDRIGGHFATQVYGFNTVAGGGIFALSDWKNKNPIISDLIKDRHVVPTSVCSRLANKKLNYGSFMSPEVSFDGKNIYFSHCGSKEHRWIWTPETTWNIFKMPVDGKTIEQLTDSSFNDFDVCELPSGRLVFCSERRGGFIRCFAESARLRVTTAVLHGMKNDGSDIYPLSFFETSEWQPSVDNNGMLVYTRWDYTDRENCLGSTYWTCFPDGRNPRSPHGNYPYPWHTFPDNKHGDHRYGNCPDAPSALPMTEMQFRAIPDSSRFIFTAAPHHGETFGSLCMLDLRVKNDNHASQIRRLTPYTPFPESECKGRSQYQYGSPWPLSEDLYLCCDWENLVILDRYGNKELLCEREILPIDYDPRLRLTDPIPLRPRLTPPVIPQQTTQGHDHLNENHHSTVGIVNVNISDLPFPKDRPVKRLRVFQVLPKPNPWMNMPDIGYAPENTPRIPLGTVPVEKDGSVFFEAPSGKQLLFQVLDEQNRAVQTMRAVTFTHPGEKLICVGCHEPVDMSVANEKSYPLAFRRPASKLQPECGLTEPVNFYRNIAPVFEKNCVSCHVREKKGPQNMDYESMRPYVFYFSGGMAGTTVRVGIHGGSRSIPGRVGAAASKLDSILRDKNHLDKVSDSIRHKIVLWLDANAPRLGAFQDEDSQMKGELVWPILDTQPCEQYDPERNKKPVSSNEPPKR